MSPCPTQPCLLHKGTSYSINVTFASSKHCSAAGVPGECVGENGHLRVPLFGQGQGKVAGEGSGWEEVAGEEEWPLVVFLQPSRFVEGRL